MRITSMGNHEAAEGISEYRRSSCSSVSAVLIVLMDVYHWALDWTTIFTPQHSLWVALSWWIVSMALVVPLVAICLHAYGYYHISLLLLCLIAWINRNACFILFISSWEMFMIIEIWLKTWKNIKTRMWYMISPATPTVCLEHKSENFQSRNVTLSMLSSSQK